MFKHLKNNQQKYMQNLLFYWKAWQKSIEKVSVSIDSCFHNEIINQKQKLKIKQNKTKKKLNK